MTTTNTTIVVDSKTAEDLTRILKINPLTNGEEIVIKVQKNWDEMNEEERYDSLLTTVKNLETLERAKIEFRGYGVSHCRSFEEIAAVVYAAGKRERKDRCGEIKNFPSSKQQNVIEWRADGRIFVNGREGFLTGGKNAAIMLTSDK